MGSQAQQWNSLALPALSLKELGRNFAMLSVLLDVISFSYLHGGVTVGFSNLLLVFAAAC
jgi:hypothetical protein